MRKKFEAWVTTAQLAEEIGCGRYFLLRNREALFKQGTHWRILNPHSARPTYRWNRTKVLKILQND